MVISVDEVPKEPLTLAMHLAQGYYCYQHGKLGPWNRAIFAAALANNPDLMTEAQRKQGELDAVLRSGRTCHISATQRRIVADGIRGAQALMIKAAQMKDAVPLTAAPAAP